MQFTSLFALAMGAFTLVQAAPAARDNTIVVRDNINGTATTEVTFSSEKKESKLYEAPIGVDGEASTQAFTLATVYTNSNFGGSALTLVTDFLPTGCQGFGSPFVDSISSLRVSSGIRCVFWNDGGCSGSGLIVGQGDLSYVGDSFNDRFSTWQCEFA